MIRVVLDTNVVVSALLTRKGSEAHALDLAAARKIKIYVTTEILAEYEAVLRRSKFRRLDPKEVGRALQRIRQIATLVHPKERLAVSPDDDDNRFLECAEAANADYLVTGNTRHFPTQWKQCRIIGARQLAALLIDAERAK